MDEATVARGYEGLPSRVEPAQLRPVRERGPVRPVARASTGSWLAVVAMLGAVSLWGPSFVATKVALRDLPPLTIAFLRFLIASCVLYPLWCLSRDGARLGRATHRRLFVGGLLGVTGYFVLENLGVQRTTAGDAALLMAAIPVIVLLVEAAWLKQAVTRKRGAGILLSFAGVFLLISGGRAVGGSHRLLGDLLIMAAAFLWAAYSLLGRTVNPVPKLAVATYQAMYGTVMLAPFALLERSRWHVVSPHSALAVVYLGVMCSAATYLLYNYALRALAASQVTAFLNLVPVIGAGAAVLVLGEHLYLTQVLGGGVILLGVVMSTRAQSARLPSGVRRAVGTRRVRRVGEPIRLQDSEGGDMDQTQEEVRAHHAEVAVLAVRRGRSASQCCSGDQDDAEGQRGYTAAERGELPNAAILASLGCGNPTSVADLGEGESVLDLGSGGRIDVLLSAKRVGPTGKVYGLDLTEEMLALAPKNKEEAGATNVEFLKGYVEDIPLPAASVDVVISNCVINRSTDELRVFAEMARVLKAGGRIGITDIVASNDLTPEQRAVRGSHVGCIAGALSFAEYEEGFSAAGFEDISVTPTHEAAQRMYSAIIKATKVDSPTVTERRAELPVLRQSCC